MDIANHVYMYSTHVSKLFKKETGMIPTEFRNKNMK
ncbi:MAG: AraC family transcriptional regulator [Anaeromicrobium sp.]|nr:helix-turn-helix transcriptional regulator [Anaeromicrobium sp.]MCT4593854.1 AraC family transcriptional regulator [Anaeromicrobium sp.]